MIVIVEKHVRLRNAKILNNKWLRGIYNESRKSRTNGHEEKLVIEAWQLKGMLESVCGWS